MYLWAVACACGLPKWKVAGQAAAAAHLKGLGPRVRKHASCTAPMAATPTTPPPQQAAPPPISLIYVRGENTTINVKRLPKIPAPPRFGRKLTEGQKALATHVCVDCGYVYTDT